MPLESEGNTEPTTSFTRRFLCYGPNLTCVFSVAVLFPTAVEMSGHRTASAIRSAVLQTSALASSTAEVSYNLIWTTSVNLELGIGPSQTLYTSAQKKTS